MMKSTVWAVAATVFAAVCLFAPVTEAGNAAWPVPEKTVSADSAAFFGKLRSLGKTVSITCSFTERKSLKALSSDVVRTGEFSFSAPDTVALVYSDGDRIDISGGGFTMVSAGKVSEGRLRSNPVLSRIYPLIKASADGDFSGFARDGKLEVYRSGAGYELVYIPSSAFVSRYLSCIRMRFSGEDMAMDRLRMEEASGNVLEYSFTDRKIERLQ